MKATSIVTIKKDKKKRAYFIKYTDMIKMMHWGVRIVTGGRDKI